MYFPRYLTAKTMTTCFAVKVLSHFGESIMPMYLINSCAKGATYVWQNSILIFYINRENKSLNLVLTAVAHESDGRRQQDTQQDEMDIGYVASDHKATRK